MRFPVRRHLSALFALLYLLVAGGAALEHAWADPVTAHAEAHVHAQGDGDEHCPTPPHDEAHCPSCKLAGLRTLPASSSSCELVAASSAARAPVVSDETAPSLRSHAPPGSRAPPLG